MKAIPYLLLLSLLLTLSCEQEQASTDIEETEKAPNDWLFRQRAYPSGTIDEVAYRHALKTRDQQRQAQNIDTNNKDLITAPWQLDGPINVGGRVTDVEVIAGTPEVLLVGAASGGVFRSVDNGTNWEAVFDEMPTLAIGDLAVARSNAQVVYAGTGEPNAGGGSLAYDGLGVFKSEDAGATWTSKGLEDVGSIGRIAIDPSNSERLYVAAMGTLFANNDERGIYRSLDGGDNWEQVLFVSDSTGGIDLAIHPDEPLTVYAALWERVRRPNRRSYTGPTSGIYKSTNGGDSWTELTNGLPADAFFKGRTSLAIAPSDANRIYAGYVAESGQLANMMTSENGGDSWSNLPTTNLGVVSFDWWFNRVVVSPTNAQKLYYVGFNINEYDVNSQSWGTIFQGAHVDQHTLWIDPANTNRMLVGNDGGLYYSENGGSNFSKWENLPITQFYTSEIDAQVPERRYGGTQDNGTNRTLSGSNNDWERIYGGDGFRVLVDPTDNTYVYAASQYGNLGRSIDGGNNFFNATAGLEGTRRNWFTPYLIDPSNNQQLYVGTEAVYRSTNQATTWTRISPDLSNGNTGNNGLVYATITALDVSAADNQVIWAGTDDGNVWVTINGGTNWTKVSDELPNRWVTSLATDPNDAATVYLTYSGFRYGTNMSHVYKSDDYGANWQDLNGDLPDIPVNEILLQPENGNLILATDIGVYFSENDGLAWQPLGLGLPPVVVTDLTYHAPTETLVAGTFGRSMWSVNLGETVSTLALARLELDWQIFPNPTNGLASLKATIVQAGDYSITLHSVEGRLVRSLFTGKLLPGSFQRALDLQDLAKGNYLLRWTRDGRVTSGWVVKM